MKSESTTFTVENKPFKNLRIITLEIRDKGGRAYKVCADIGGHKNLYFDARETIILDSMFEIGISKGGIIDADFIFCKVGAQMMPVRLGSYLHSKMIEATQYDEAKPLDNLELGGIYENKKGEKHIYMGEYWARTPKIEWERTADRGSYYSKETIKSIVFAKMEKVHVFYESYLLKYPDLEKDLWFRQQDDTGYSKYYKKGDASGYNFVIVKKHSFKEKVGAMQVPEGYIEIVKNQNVKNATNPEYLKIYPLEAKHGLLDNYARLLTVSKDKDFIHPLLASYKHE